jgi:16S rRNA processing protein RimM
MLPENLKYIGFLTKPHGIDGTIVMKIEEDAENDLLKREFLFLSIDNTMIPFFIEDARISGDTAFIKFLDYNSEKDSGQLKGNKVFIESETLGEESQLRMLVGYSFKDNTSGKEGVLTDYEEYNENLVFVVKSNEQEYLLPVNADLILYIDNKKKHILMALPEGIFDLDT